MRTRKTFELIFLGAIISLISLGSFSCKSGNAKNGISLLQADSILNAKSIYSLDYEAFVEVLDSVQKLVSTKEDQVSVKYYFATKHFAYNQNHSLEKKLPSVKMFFNYKNFPVDIDLRNDNLLENEYYKNFVTTYLDLKAKYAIADGTFKNTENLFSYGQWDVARHEFTGAVKEFALYHVLKHQIKIFGHEFDPYMLTYFKNEVENKSYLKTIDSLYSVLINLKAETEEIVYKVAGKDSLSAYVFYPEKEEKNRPCILVLHGGGWYIGHPLTRTHMHKHFNELGVVAIAVEHRIKGRQDATPAEGLMDAKAAIRWARENADHLGIDPKKIIISGLSSGGTLAALTAMVDGYELEDENLDISSKPNACIVWSGCVDVTVNGWFDYCLKGTDKSINLSPTHLIRENLPPFMIFQGKLDHFNHYSTHQDFCDKMKAAGNVCDLVMYENTGHVEVYEKDMMDEYERFLEENLDR